MNRRTPQAFGVSFALHVTCVLGAISLAPHLTAGSAGRLPPSTLRATESGITIVSRQSLDTPKRARSVKAAARPPELVEDDSVVGRNGPASPLDIPGFVFDFTKVRDRGRTLFPFLTLRLPLGSDASPERDGATHLVNPFARDGAPSRPKSTLPPLELSDEALQTLIDHAWSRRDRWRTFEPLLELAERHNPDTGRVPAMLRKYIDQNLLQPYLDPAIPDPRFWTELGIAADHADYIDFITRYTSKHPSTRAATELMFLLDKLAQGSYDALVTLLGATPNQMNLTRDRSREASNLVDLLRRYYRSELDLKDLLPHTALRMFYDNVRLTILTGILETSPDGYRASDARFLIGGIYWRQGRNEDAIRAWREMTIDPADDYVTWYSDILDAVGRADPDGGTIDRGRINDALDAQRREWLKFWEARLKQFGFSFDTY